MALPWLSGLDSTFRPLWPDLAWLQGTMQGGAAG